MLTRAVWVLVAGGWVVACVSPPLPLLLWPVLALLLLSAVARRGGR